MEIILDNPLLHFIFLILCFCLFCLVFVGVWSFFIKRSPNIDTNLIEEGIEDNTEEIKEKPEIKGPSLDEIIGQDSFVEYAKNLIEVYNETGKVLPHMLFYGTSGTGKTALAGALAKEMNVDCYFITGTQLSTKSEILKLVDSIKQGDLVVVDEIHRLREMHATMIYSILQDNNYSVDGQLIEVPKCTFIGVTTHEGLLPAALRNRLSIRIPFFPYGKEDIKKIIRNCFGFKEEILNLISEISFGIVRDAITLSNTISSMCRDPEMATKETFDKVRTLLGYDENGLTYAEIDTINYLKHGNNIPVGMATLANAINVEKVTIEQRTKPKLLQLGLAKTNGTKGLNLTEKGLNYGG